MDISNRTIWQQASGETDRNYADLCIRWDVILNGPGDTGPWPNCIGALREIGRSEKKITDLRRFSEDIKEGDLIVLRFGTSEVPAVGEVVGSYEWHDNFGDIDGWELEHVRRVRWLWHSLDSPKRFHTYALKQGDTTQRLNPGSVTEWLKSLKVSPSAYKRPIAQLPLAANEMVRLEDISEFLFDHGVASSSITNLLSEIGELIRIAKWYQRSTSNPSEHETVAYLAVPLLRGLGWTPQRMAVEWKHIDIALFEQLPRTVDTLRVVVEAKKMGGACLGAKLQATGYANGRTACQRLILTDGLRFGIYVSQKKAPAVFELYAYLNLTRLRQAYPVYGCEGANAALLAMAPEWRRE